MGGGGFVVLVPPRALQVHSFLFSDAYFGRYPAVSYSDVSYFSAHFEVFLSPFFLFFGEDFSIFRFFGEI